MKGAVRSGLTSGVPGGKAFAHDPGGAAGEGLLGARFRATLLLKEGLGVTTWLGTDLENGAEVVLKTARVATMAPGALLRLEHEAEILSGLQSPWLTPLLQAGHDGDFYFMALPRVPGMTLQEWLATKGAMTPLEALTLGRCVLSALHAVHAEGVLHRDVKPTNVLVQDDGEAVLIDFGLARSTRLSATLRELPVGSASYMSPEQAGLLEHDVGPRSDLYSVGVLLFESLAGHPPFQAERVGEVLRMHVVAQPPEFRTVGVEAPRALEGVIQRLLRKDPRERYQTARAVLDDLETLEEALRRGEPDPELVVGLSDVRRTLTEPAFVGRGEELAALMSQLEAARQGRGGTALLEAPSGGGKSWVLEELTQRATRDHAWILRGAAKDAIAPVPFQVLEGVASEILATLAFEPGAAEELRHRLGDQQEAVGAALPQLGTILAGAPGEALGPEAHGEVRNLRALSALLRALGTPARPALVLLDDCQWADELSQRLLQAFEARAREGDCHVLLVLAFRSEEVQADHLLRSLRPLVRVELGPFRAGELRTLVESMAGVVPEEIQEAVRRLSEGNPFMAAEVLRGLVETGTLVGEPGGWRAHAASLADMQSSRRAAGLLARRLDLLPEDSRRLLTVGALLGKTFDLDFVADLAGQPPGAVIRCLDEARQRHLLWADAGGTRLTFVHDKLRETLLARLPDDERREMHRAAADRLERLDPVPVFEAAYHFDNAGEAERALPYAVEAADRSRFRHALQTAEGLYRIAERGAAHSDDAIRRRIAEGLGDVLMLRGRYDEAAAGLEEARGLAREAVDQAQIELKLGELAFKRGDMKSACDALERGLGLLGRPVPRKPILALLKELGVQTAHTLFPRLLLARRPLKGADAELLAVRLYSRLAYAYWFQRGAVPTMWAHLRELNLAERYPTNRELGQACSNHGPGMTMVPYLSRAIAYARRGLAIRRALGDRWGEGQALHFLGVALFAGSRLREALNCFREAVRLLERTGDRWEVNAARYHVAFALYRLGDLEEAVATSRQVHAAGLEIGDSFASGASLNIWAKASGGRVPAAILATELRRPSEDMQRNAEVRQAEGIRLIGAGDGLGAAAALDEAWRVAREAGLRTEYVAGIPGWQATACRLALERLPAGDEGVRLALLARMRRAVRLARSQAGLYRNNLPHALREEAHLELMQGRPDRARKLLERSLKVAAEQDAAYERAQTLRSRGALGQALGWPGAARDAMEARRLLIAMGVEQEAEEEASRRAESVSLSLVDRFATVVEVGRRIATALTRDTVYEALREAALMLLRGEECHLLEAAPGSGPVPDCDDLHPVGGEEAQALDISRSLVTLALHSGRPVSIREGPEESPSESVIFYGLRSALCAPVYVRGEAVACLYVTNRHVGRLFGEDEERLAGFIATLAGAALENAEGFARAEGLNVELQASLRRLQETQVRLVHTERMAVAGRVAGGVAHDFNNLLTVVTGYARMVLAELEPEDPLHTEVGEILQAGERATALTRQLLAFSRRQVMDTRVLDLNAIVRRMERMLRRVVGEDIQVATALDPDLGSIRSDVTQIEQVVMNLAVNARDAMPQGGTLVFATSNVELTAEDVANHPNARPGRHVLLSVGDSGCGMDAETRARIFEPFFTTKGPGRGTGLGLATVYGIVDQTGGLIRVASEVGVGTTFDILLPAVEGVAEGPSAGESQTLVAGSGVILLVEDEAPVRTLARKVLERSGYTVLVAEDGAQAMEIGQSYPDHIDLLISDVVMPAMNGPELARRLKALRPRMKLMFMSGYPDEDLVQRGILGSELTVVGKPFTPVSLAAKVAEVLDTEET